MHKMKTSIKKCLFLAVIFSLSGECVSEDNLSGKKPYEEGWDFQLMQRTVDEETLTRFRSLSADAKEIVFTQLLKILFIPNNNNLPDKSDPSNLYSGNPKRIYSEQEKITNQLISDGKREFQEGILVGWKRYLCKYDIEHIQSVICRHPKYYQKYNYKKPSPEYVFIESDEQIGAIVDSFNPHSYYSFMRGYSKGSFIANDLTLRPVSKSFEKWLDENFCNEVQRVKANEKLSEENAKQRLSGYPPLEAFLFLRHVIINKSESDTKAIDAVPFKEF